MRIWSNQYCDSILREEVTRFALAFNELCDFLHISSEIKNRIISDKTADEWSVADYISGATLVDSYIKRSSDALAFEASVNDIVWRLSGRGVFTKSKHTYSITQNALEHCIERTILTSEHISDFIAEHFITIPCVSSLLCKHSEKTFVSVFDSLEKFKTNMVLPTRTIDSLMAEKFKCDATQYDHICRMCDILADAQKNGLIDQRGDKDDPLNESDLLFEVFSKFSKTRAMAIITQEPVLARDIINISPEHIIAVGIDECGEFFIHSDDEITVRKTSAEDDNSSIIDSDEIYSSNDSEVEWNELTKRYSMGQETSEPDTLIYANPHSNNQGQAQFMDDEAYEEFVKLMNEEE